MIERKIRTLLAYVGISQAELARKMGMSPANFNQKIKRNTLTYEEMEKIAEICGATWRAEFITEDGMVI